MQLVQVRRLTDHASILDHVTNTPRLLHKVKNEDALERYQEQTIRCYDVLEAQLRKSNGETIIPGGYTSADFHYYPWIHLHGKAGLTLDNHPLISKWYYAMSGVKEVKAAYDRIRKASEAAEL